MQNLIFFKSVCSLLPDEFILWFSGPTSKITRVRARNLIFFTIDLQTVNYYSTIHC